MANEIYVPNRYCGCARCCLRGLLGPTLLMTFGVLMLLSELHLVRFHYTWPIILIVVGVFKIFQGSTPASGHQNFWANPAAAPPPPPPSGEVHHG
jgi:hypothetical protein